MILRIGKELVELLMKEAQEKKPIETCAILFGKFTRKEAIAGRVVVTSNMLRSTKEFLIDPETFVQAFAEAEKDGLDLIGLFHSHPAPAKPSSIDLRYMRLWGDILWLILSLTTGDLCVYQMKDARMREITMIVE